MRKFRNPRFAPESLERRLSPSTILVTPIYSTTCSSTQILPGDMPPPTDPPPPLPTGPTGPAAH